MRELADILEAVQTRPGEILALATLAHAEGSTYRRAGARMLVFADGTSVGSISGGCLEADVVERARRAAAAGAPETVVYDTTSDEDIVWGLGLGCNGVVTVTIRSTSLDGLRPPCSAEPNRWMDSTVSPSWRTMTVRASANCAMSGNGRV